MSRFITANKILRYAEMELQKRTLSNKPGSEEGADKLVKRPSLNLNIFLVNDVSKTITRSTYILVYH